MKSMIALLAFAVAARALAQPLPPPGPPGYPMFQGPVLAISVLEADLRAKAGSDTVRFARDSYVLTQQSLVTLTAQARWLIQHPFVRASIEGHADGRQTREYSLALGERRAAAVRNYLIASGVPPEQLDVVSWGKERPATPAMHDATWLQNSRVVTVLKQPPLPTYPMPLPQPQLPQGE